MPIDQHNSAHVQGQESLTATMLAAVPPQEQKQMLGVRLFPLVQRLLSNLAGKITGMLLEMDNFTLLYMLEHNDFLQAKVKEAIAVLIAYMQTAEQVNTGNMSSADPSVSAQNNLLEEDIEQLRCFICKGYLSCGPLRVLQNGNSICGRCLPETYEPPAPRNLALENVLKKVKFPCRFGNKGCLECVLFGHVEHESVCNIHLFCPTVRHVHLDRKYY